MEGSDLDAKLVREQLIDAGIEAHVTKVQTEKDFRAVLDKPGIDVILADRVCSDCDGSRALAIAREKRPEIPFIFVSGPSQSSEALDSLNSGVTDSVLKENLATLAPAVRRAVNEAQQRSELRRAREILTAQAALLDQANDSIILCDAQDTITYWNRGAQDLYGWSAHEAVGKKCPRPLANQVSRWGA